jgi:hypothetical protein
MATDVQHDAPPKFQIKIPLEKVGILLTAGSHF